MVGISEPGITWFDLYVKIFTPAANCIGNQRPEPKGKQGDASQDLAVAHVIDDSSLEHGVPLREELASSVGGTFYLRCQVNIQVEIMDCRTHNFTVWKTV